MPCLHLLSNFPCSKEGCWQSSSLVVVPWRKGWTGEETEAETDGRKMLLPRSLCIGPPLSGGGQAALMCMELSWVSTEAHIPRETSVLGRPGGQVSLRLSYVSIEWGHLSLVPAL